MTWQDDGFGVSADSVGYYREHRHELGCIVQAAVTFPGLGDDDPYTMVLRDDRGARMLLSGCTAGYAGECPRTAMEILIEAGFDAEIAQVVFTHRVVRMIRGEDGATVLTEALGVRQGDPSDAHQAVSPLDPVARSVMSEGSGTRRSGLGV
jgi:hypothetical protein